jgi:hypothetical protein
MNHQNHTWTNGYGSHVRYTLANSTSLSEQISNCNQQLAKRTGCWCLTLRRQPTAATRPDRKRKAYYYVGKSSRLSTLNSGVVATKHKNNGLRLKNKQFLVILLLCVVHLNHQSYYLLVITFAYVWTNRVIKISLLAIVIPSEFTVFCFHLSLFTFWVFPKDWCILSCYGYLCFFGSYYTTNTCSSISSINFSIFISR